MAKTKNPERPKKKHPKTNIYIYIVPPDVQQVGRFRSCKSLLSLLNSQTDTNRFPRARTLLAGPGASRAASPPSPRCSLPPCGSWRHLWLCAPAAAVGVSAPPAGQKCMLAPSLHGSGSRWEVGRGLHFPSGARVLHLASQRGSQPYLQADLDPISCPPFLSGLPRWKMVPEAGGRCGEVTCFLFFFFFLFFLNKSSFLYNHELRGPCETPLPHGRLVHFGGMRQMVPIARPAVDRQRREGRTGPEDLSRH